MRVFVPLPSLENGRVPYTEISRDFFYIRAPQGTHSTFHSSISLKYI